MLPHRRLLPVKPELPPLSHQQIVKKYSTHACDECHKRKVKTIVLTEGNTKSRQIAKLFDSLPEHEAAELLQEFVARGAAPGLPKQISEHDLVRNILPPTRNSVEFELTIRYPVAYPTLYPLQLTTFPLESILELNSITLSRPARQRSAFQLDSGNTGTSTGSSIREVDHKPLFRKRLEDVDIGIWTEVPILNGLAIRIISFYFDVDYAIFPLFDADLFIEDLARGRRWFCSKLLVNCLLCCACQMYTPFNPNMSTLSVAFFNEANRLLNQENQETQLNTLTSVAALQLLCLSSCMLGFYDDASTYMKHSVQIGTRMGLFGVHSTSESANAWLADHKDWSRAASYTAWGVFNWVVKYGIHFQCSEIDAPPTLLRPGALEIPPIDQAEIIIEIKQHAEYFDASCEFWSIMHNVAKKRWGLINQIIPSDTTLETAETVYRQLLSWAAKLPLGLVRGEETTHNTMLLHMYCHCMISDLFRPFLASPWRATPLRSFDSPYTTPEAIHAASTNQLKRMLLLFCFRCKLGLFSLFYHTAVLYVVNALVLEIRRAPSASVTTGAECRFYMDLCIAGGQANAGSYRAFGSVASGLLAMALQNGIINIRKAARVARELRELRRHHDAVEELGKRAPGGWVVDQALAMTDPEAAAVDNLADRLQKLMVSDGVSMAD